VTAERGDDLRGPSEEKWVMWGGHYVDLDGDGYEELLVSQAPVAFGERNQELLGPILLRNHGGTFERERYAFGVPLLARGMVLADLDGDGDDDVIVAPLFGRFRVFVNDSPARDVVRVELEATVSAPSGAGAVVRARYGDEEQKRLLVAGGRPFVDGPLVADIAAGGATAMDLTIIWPSGAVQQVADSPVGRTMAVSEPTWLNISDPRPPADNSTIVEITVDAAAAGLGDAGTQVTWTSAGTTLEATADAAGIARFSLPPRDVAGPIQGTLAIDGKALPGHPAVDYQ